MDKTCNWPQWDTSGLINVCIMRAQGDKVDFVEDDDFGDKKAA